jgi:hypothetical protein
LIITIDYIDAITPYYAISIITPLLIIDDDINITPLLLRHYAILLIDITPLAIIDYIIITLLLILTLLMPLLTLLRH